MIITLVGLMESIAVAKALAERNGYDLDANQELAGALMQYAASVQRYVPGNVMRLLSGMQQVCVCSRRASVSVAVSNLPSRRLDVNQELADAQLLCAASVHRVLWGRPTAALLVVCSRCASRSSATSKMPIRQSPMGCYFLNGGQQSGGQRSTCSQLQHSNCPSAYMAPYSWPT